MSKSTASRKYAIKVILVGSSGVGKTSLVSSFFDNPFESQALPTVAPASSSYVVELQGGIKVELQIWDTAGQERFQSISQMFYRDSHVAFVCYDEQNASSIENWINKVRQEVPECIIFLVTTKSDLLSEEQVSRTENEANNLIQSGVAKAHFMTSASKGSGIRELFQAAALCYDQVYAVLKPVLEINDKPGNKEGKCC